MKNKLLSLGVTAALMAGMLVVPTSAVIADDNDLALATLQSMGVVDTSSLDLSSGLTRAQLADMLIEITDNTSLLATAATRSPFSDVSPSHWASSQINLAYQLGYLNGNGDGTFAPDRVVTLGEAVTTVLRVLGYSSADIGYAWPSDYISAAQSKGLLDGIDTTASTFTYGDGVTLFAAMLKAETSSGSDYLNGLGASSVDDVLILSNDENNGVNDDLLYVLTSSGFAYYQQAIEMPYDLVSSCRGTLLLNTKGEACGFIPNDETRRTIELSDVDSSGVYNEYNALTMVSSSATMAIDDTKTTFGSSYYELEKYSHVILCYGNLGTVELVIPQTDSSTAGYVVTGYFENASPNPSQPETVQVLGATFDVDSDAASSFASIAYGDKICMTLDESGDVVSVCAYSSMVEDTMVGIIDGDEIVLTCGVTISGDITASVDNGRMVRVTPTGVDKMSAYAVSSSVAGNFNVSSKTLGLYSLADDVLIYECVGSSTVEKISLSALDTDTIDGDNVQYYHLDADGKVDIILLDNVTGDLYSYGIIVSSKISSGSSNLSTSNSAIAIQNGDGTTSAAINSTLYPYEDEVAGMVLTADGDVADAFLLPSAGTASRDAFSGSDSVVINGVRYDIADDLQVYSDSTDSWITLESAKTFNTTFECYYDKSPDEGGKIRVIFAYE